MLLNSFVAFPVGGRPATAVAGAALAVAGLALNFAGVARRDQEPDDHCSAPPRRHTRD